MVEEEPEKMWDWEWVDGKSKDIQVRRADRYAGRRNVTGSEPKILFFSTAVSPAHVVWWDWHTTGCVFGRRTRVPEISGRR